MSYSLISWQIREVGITERILEEKLEACFQICFYFLDFSSAVIKISNSFNFLLWEIRILIISFLLISLNCCEDQMR